MIRVMFFAGEKWFLATGESGIGALSRLKQVVPGIQLTTVKH
jgi:hypothetical protein